MINNRGNETINTNISEEALLKKVYETGFALDDIILYLDTHPTDMEAMNYYRFVRQANEEAIKSYEQMFGPLKADSVMGDSWNWLDSPWPWEGGKQ